MQKSFIVLAVAVSALVWLVFPSQERAALPRDPGLTSGTLSNGLRYHLLDAPNQLGDLEILLQVRVGSTVENAENLGIAHFLEHMAFKGSTEFPGDTMTQELSKMGITLGKDVNASTGREATRYTVRIPNPDTGKVSTVLQMLSGVLGRLELSSAAVEDQRRIILHEMATVDTVERRLEQARFRNIFERAALNLEPTIGTKDTLASMTSNALRGFYESWYQPANAMLLVCGDTSSVEDLTGLVERTFGSLPQGSADFSRYITVPEAAKGDRFFIQQDRALGTDNLWVAATRPQVAVRDVESFRRWLLDELMIVMVGNRIKSQAADGQIGADQILSGRSGVLDGAEVFTVCAMGRSGEWQSLASGVRDEIHRILIHGFTESELAAGKAALLGDLEKADPSGTRAKSAAETRQKFVFALDNRRQWMPNGERAQLARSLLPALSANEVEASFAGIFFSGTTSVVLETVNSTAGFPQMATLQRIFGAADHGKLQPYREDPKATVKFTPSGPPVEPMNHVFDAMLQVDDQEFANGVRIRSKEMESPDGFVRMAIVFPGVLGLESEDTRGLTGILAGLLSDPEIGAYTASDVSRWMLENRVSIDAKMEGANLTLVVACKPENLDAALGCLDALVVSFSCSEAHLARQLNNARATCSKTQTSPSNIAVEELRKMAYGGDARALSGYLSARGTLESQTILSWWQKILRAVPARLSLVGPGIDQNAAAAAASIFARLRIDPAPTAIMEPALRQVMGSIDTEAVLQNTENSTFVLMAGELLLRDAKDVMTAMVVSRLLKAALMQTIREDAKLAYSINVSIQNGIAMDLKDLLLVTLNGTGGSGAELSRAAKEAIARFQFGDEALAIAKESALQRRASDEKSASYWSAQLASATDNRRLAEEIRGAQELVDAVSAADVMTMIGALNRANRFYTVILDREGGGLASREHEKKTVRSSQGLDKRS